MSPTQQHHASIESCAISEPAHPERFVSHRAEWHESPALAMDEYGMILNCNKSGEKLFGYRCHDLVWQHVSILFPQLSGVALFDEARFNPLLKYICHCGHLFQSQKRQGDTFLSELSFVHLDYDARRTLRLIVRPAVNAEAWRP